MRYEKIYLEDVFGGLEIPPKKTPLTMYIPNFNEDVYSGRSFKCVLICPGGGYTHTSLREAEPVALRLAGQGIAAAVVDYSTDGPRYPMQLLQVLAAVTYLRRNSSDLHIDPDKIAVMGFSAGGHAACSAGVFWQEESAEKALGIAHGEDKPNGMILCYPVITSGKFAHRGSFDALLGDNPSEELLERTSLEKHVTENTPKTFLWHTDEDGLVPAENSLLFAMALREKGIPLELHIYPKGRHGMSLCDETVDRPEILTDSEKYCSEWFSRCVKWIKENL